MDIDTLRNIWKQEAGYNASAVSALWDEMAPRFGRKKAHSLDDSAFLKLIGQRVELTADKTVLDIGCGTGRYSLALAPKVGQVTGTDISEAMLEIAKEDALAQNAANANFCAVDWKTADIEKLSWRKGFDIVFAHMTPAVSDFVTLDKMVACAKKHCFLRKPARRTDDILNSGLEHLGLAPRDKKSDASMEYTFCYLWNMGFEPAYHYEHGAMVQEMTVEDAVKTVLRWARLQREQTAEDEAELQEYFTSVSSDGLVHGQSKSTYVTIDWAIT